MRDIITLSQAADILGVSERSLSAIYDTQVSWSKGIIIINIHGEPHFRKEDILNAKMIREKKY